MRVFFITTLTFNLVTCLLEANIYAQDYAEVEWVRNYLGPDSLNSNSKALEIDRWGNVYVGIDDISRSDSGFSHDYVIIKYNGAGAEEWKVRYSNPDFSGSELGGIVVDQLGNLYAAGDALVRTDSLRYYVYVILKYDQNGTLQWLAIEEATNSVLSKIKGLAIDDSNNVYTTSLTGDMFKHTADGRRIWSRKENRYHYGLALDANSNIYVTGVDFVSKYDSDGIKRWEKANPLEPRTTRADDSGYIYVCGRMGLTKYLTDGTEQWTGLYSQGFFLVDYLTIDNVGNPVVLGSYYNGVYDQHAVAKYDANGVQLWEAFSHNPTFEAFSGITTDICSDKLGNLYVVRYSNGNDGTSALETIKFASSGEQKWFMRYGDLPPANLVGPNVVVEVDSMGNVYVTGVTVFRNNDEEVVTIKYRQPNFTTSVASKIMSESVFGLFPNYPNPFNPTTTIRYSLQKSTHVRMEILNPKGQTIRNLVNEEKVSGVHSVVWDGRTERGYLAASGIYFCRLIAEGVEKSSKLVLLR